MERRLPFQLRDRSLLVRLHDESAGPPPAPSLEERLSACLVNLDKPPGPTSRKTADRVERILGRGPTGHSGTLDPAVTGVLPVAVGRATPALAVLLEAGKEYRGRLRLHRRAGLEELRAGAARFLGPTVQTPPVRSRVRRRPRTRSIYYFDILSLEGRTASFLAGVQAGTYIRKLVHDLGQALGTGAHMESLRRTRAGPFAAEDAVTLETLEEAARDEDPRRLLALLLPPAAAVEHLGKVWYARGADRAVRTGSPLYLPGVARLTAGIRPGDTVALFPAGGPLAAIGVAEASSEDMLATPRGVAVRTRRVLRPWNSRDEDATEGG